MFHHRRRRHPLADVFDWTDYRVGGMPPLHSHFGPAFGRGFSPWRARRRSPLVRLLIGLAVVVAVVYVIQRLTSSRRDSWI